MLVILFLFHKPRLNYAKSLCPVQPTASFCLLFSLCHQTISSVVGQYFFLVSFIIPVCLTIVPRVFLLRVWPFRFLFKDLLYTDYDLWRHLISLFRKWSSRLVPSIDLSMTLWVVCSLIAVSVSVNVIVP